jgi:hypothetical protein
MSDPKQKFFRFLLPPSHQFTVRPTLNANNKRRVKKNNHTEEQQPGAARLNPKLKMAES